MNNFKVAELKFSCFLNPNLNFFLFRYFWTPLKLITAHAVARNNRFHSSYRDSLFIMTFFNLIMISDFVVKSFVLI